MITPTIPQGIDTNGYVHPLLVDSQGHPLVLANGQDGTGTARPILTDATGRSIIVGSNSNHPFAFENPVLDSKTATMTTGTNTPASSTTPTGKMWKITRLLYAYSGTITGLSIQPTIYTPTPTPATIQFHPTNSTLTTGIYNLIDCELYLISGQCIYYIIQGATVGNSFNYMMFGYQMDVN